MIVILLFLSILAASSRFLRGNLLERFGPRDPEIVRLVSDGRTCQSAGTVFADVKTLQKATDLFREKVSAVVSERETYLTTSSAWTCLDDKDGDLAALRGLAAEMPGWHYIAANGDVTLRPVTFASFASILAEFQREYECKLNEFSASADAMVANNLDLDDPSLTFCCNDTDLCVQNTPGTNCGTTPSDDATCGGSCGSGNGQEILAARLGPFRTRIERDKERARSAVLRTVHALRSFELNYAYAKQLSCFQRASLDLKNEVSLLADTISCMPKIWDAATSLHDPDDSLRSSSAP